MWSVNQIILGEANMKNTIRKQKGSIEVELDVIVSKEGEYFVAYCPALELSSYGDTEKEARNSFDEALDIFVEETSQKGSLLKFLQKIGWTLQQNPVVKYIPPIQKHAYEGKVSREFVQFSI